MEIGSVFIFLETLYLAYLNANNLNELTAHSNFKSQSIAFVVLLTTFERTVAVTRY